MYDEIYTALNYNILYNSEIALAMIPNCSLSHLRTPHKGTTHPLILAIENGNFKIFHNLILYGSINIGNHEEVCSFLEGIKQYETANCLGNKFSRTLCGYYKIYLLNEEFKNHMLKSCSSKHEKTAISMLPSIDIENYRIESEGITHTLLTLAIRNKAFTLAKEIISKKPSLANEVIRIEMTPLQYANLIGNYEISNLLAGRNISMHKLYGEEKSHTPMIYTLISQVIDITSQSRKVMAVMYQKNKKNLY